MLLTFNQNNFRHLLNTDCHSLFGRPLGLPLFIYLFSLLLLCCETLSAPGPSKGQWFVDVSSICDIEWFNLATRECIKQWAACKIIYCSYFILGLLHTALAPDISPSTASKGTAAESQWLYSWYGLDLLCRVRVMCGSVQKWDRSKWKFKHKQHPKDFETPHDD